MSEFHGYARHGLRESRWLLWAAIPTLALFGLVATTCSWFGEAATVARKEFGPRAALKKYEWFKEAHAQMQRRRADLSVYEARLAAARSVANPDRTDKERSAIAESEYAGLVASLNGLVAEYNAASSKFNWAPFQGEIPATVEPYIGGLK